MSFKLPAQPFLLLLGACCLAGAQPRLSLDAAIRAALENNFAYRIAELEPAIAEDLVTGQQAAFDTELFAGAEAGETEGAATGATTDSRTWQAGARKRLVYGTTVTAQTTLDRVDSASGSGTPAFDSLSQSADLALSLRQPLLRGFGRDANLAGVQRARAGQAIAAQSFRDTVQQVLADVELAYWSVARWQEQLELNRSNLSVAEALLDEARERERVGVATQIDVLQAEASRAQRQEEIIETTRQLGDAFDQLLNAMGTLPEGDGTAPDRVVDALTDSGQSLPAFPEMLGLALQRDPALAAQEAAIAQREWDRVAARSAARPSLDLVLSGAWSGIDDADAEAAYRDAWDREGHAWAAGVELSFPWSLRGERADLRIAGRRLDQETLRYEELRQGLVRQVRATWRSLDAVRQSLEAARLTVNLQEAVFDREKSKYEEGLSAFRDVLQAQSDLDQARIRLLNTKYNKLAAEIGMARLAGTLFERHDLLPELPEPPSLPRP